MKIDCNQSLRLGLFQTAFGLARLLQVFWMFPLALRAFVRRGWLRRNRGLSPIVFGLAVLTALASGVANGQASRGAADLGPHAESEFAPAPANVRAQAQRRLPQSRLPAQVVLDRVEAARLGIEAAVQPPKPGVPLKIGFSRDVPMLRTTAQTSALMVWTGVPGGQIAAISITSPDALGVRLGLLVEKLPTTALLRFYAQGTDLVFEVSGQEIMETIARNLAAGDNSDEARTYWSPVIDGQEITVEIELPAGVSPDEVRFSIPRVSHLFSSPLDTRALQERIGQAASCDLDSMCYTSTWGNESLATAKMAFTSGGYSYVCTGTLMNDLDTGTYIPFFLTAGHCIPTQTEASTVQTYWFYRSSSCNSGSLSPSMQTLTGGASLLYANSVTDTSFMRLNSTPPAGALYSGWTANLPALNTPGTAIHNPKGDLQKISFGTITDYENCISSGSGTFSCSSASTGSADHFGVVWSQGITEPGSSGSGLWVASGSSHYLVGQLNGGSSSCTTHTSDSYGSFGVAYNAALYQWLGNFIVLPEDGFPPGGSLPAGWVQPAGSNAPWVVASDSVYAGGFSLKSGLIGNSQRSDISSTANLSAGTVSFARKVSSESGYDFLRFYIDGVLQNSWSGEVPWSVVSFPLAAGTHTLLWSYIKDQFVAGGSDAAWIDSVTLPTAPPVYLLSIAKSGTGSGTISSSPAGISCGAACSASYSSGTNVTLSATPAAGSIFSGWSGACTGTGSCLISMSQAQNVIATFVTAPLTPAVSLSPTSLTFSSQNLSTNSAAQTITLSNTGTGTLNIASVTVSGDYGRTTTCGATLAAGANCSISVTFTPTATGTRTGAITITSNAAGSPHSMSLSGTGVLTPPTCTLTASPVVISAGSSSILTASCTPAATSYTWTNSGFGSMVSIGTVSPTTPTVYTVVASNAAGSGNVASTAVYVCNTAPSQIYAGQTLVGTGASESFHSGIGNDTIDGGAGIDTVIYNCNRTNFTLTKTVSGWTVSSLAEGIDTLSTAERLQFSNETLALDISGNAGQTYRLYQAAFNRTPDNAGLKYWIAVMDNGASLYDVAAGFINSAEFQTIYGSNPTNQQFVTKLYSNVLHRAPDQAGFDYWVGLLDTNQISRVQTLVDFSESPENQAGVIGAILNGIDLLN